MWGENNWMVNQVRSNAVTYYSKAFQYNALMSEASDEHWNSKFFIIFNSKGRIYDMNNKF